MAEVEIYSAILKEAQAAGLLEKIPETEEKIIEEGMFYLKAANEEKENGNKDKVIKAIINLGKRLGEEQVVEIFGSDKETFRGLPVPPNPEKELTNIPYDITELTDKEVRKLYGEYGAYLSRARWHLATATNKHADAVHLKNELYRNLYIKITAELEKQDKRATKDLVDAMINQNSEFKALSSAEKTFSNDLNKFKGLFDIYNNCVERLSREWTMRTDEDRRIY